MGQRDLCPSQDDFKSEFCLFLAFKSQALGISSREIKFCALLLTQPIGHWHSSRCPILTLCVTAGSISMGAPASLWMGGEVCVCVFCFLPPPPPPFFGACPPPQSSWGEMGASFGKGANVPVLMMATINVSSCFPLRDRTHLQLQP